MHFNNKVDWLHNYQYRDKNQQNLLQQGYIKRPGEAKQEERKQLEAEEIVPSAQ